MMLNDLFAAALQLGKPWIVSKVEFTELQNNRDGRGKAKHDQTVAKAANEGDIEVNTILQGFMGGVKDATAELHIYIDFERGAKFPYPDKDLKDIQSNDTGANTGVLCGVYDVKPMTWRHLNFWQYRTYIHANVPRVGDAEHSPRRVPVPWARAQSGFTLLFESFIVALAKSMPISDVAGIVGENDTRLWRIVNHYVDGARSQADYSNVSAIGIDETSKKGHKYISVFANLKTHKVLYVTDGKDQTTVDKFAADFKAHNGDCEKIEIVTADMSLGFKAGITRNLPNAATIIDKFHVIKHGNEAVDTVRKAEVKENELLRGTKYVWLKNDEALTEEQLAKKSALLSKHLKTGRACMMREELQEVYASSATRGEAESSLKKLCSWMMHSRLEPMKKFCRMLRGHWNEILNYFDQRYTNAILEGLNNIIQNIKCRARGFRNANYFATMIYLVLGEIDLDSIFVRC